MIEQRVTLRYDAQQIPAIVQAVQGDTGRDVIFELADYEIPAGATANYYIDKPDGNAVYNSAEVISSTEIRAHLTEQALAVPDRNNGQVRILSDGEVITSFDFVLEVEAFRGILHMQSETEVNIFDAAIQEAVDDAIEEIQAQTPVVTGMQNSIAPTYSSSSTYEVGDYVMYNAQLYRCITAITTAEAWTAAHWTQVPLAEDVSNLKGAFEYNGFPFVRASFSQTTINGQTGELSPATNRLTSEKVIVDDVHNFTITAESNYKFSRHFYNASGNYIGANPSGWLTKTYTNGVPTDAKYMRIVLAKSNDDTIVPTDASALSIHNVVSGFTIAKEFCSNNPNFVMPVLRNGAVSAPSNENAVAITDIIPLINAECVSVLINRNLPAGHRYQIRYNTYNISEGKTGVVETNAHRIITDAICNFSGYLVTIPMLSNYVGFGFQILEIDENDNWVPLRIETDFESVGNVVCCVKAYINKGRFLINQAGLKEEIHSIKNLGKLNNIQAFTIYDGKYYSVTEGSITEQDSTFNVLRTASVSIGHANSLQLGESKYAYASGWNDNKIYKIDLSSLIVDSSISLPTTGYTTGVVDELNSKCYILQRDTAPDTIATYKFICYDIANNNIEYEKYVDSFGALQSMDFYYGKIFALSGAPYLNIPNELHIYNTHGDLLSRSLLKDFIFIELEGIYFDRSLSGTILISNSSKDVYAIE